MAQIYFYYRELPSAHVHLKVYLLWWFLIFITKIYILIIYCPWSVYALINTNSILIQLYIKINKLFLNFDLKFWIKK